MNERLASSIKVKAGKALAALLAIMLALMAWNAVAFGTALAEGQGNAASEKSAKVGEKSATQSEDSDPVFGNGEDSKQSEDAPDSGDSESLNAGSENGSASGVIAERPATSSDTDAVSNGEDSASASKGIEQVKEGNDASAPVESGGADKAETSASNDVNSKNEPSGKANNSESSSQPSVKSEGVASSSESASKVDGSANSGQLSGRTDSKTNQSAAAEKTNTGFKAGVSALANAKVGLKNVLKNTGTKTLTATAPSNVTFNGQEQKEMPEVKDAETGVELNEGSDYSLSWSGDATNAGEVTVNVTGAGEYASSSASVTYKIEPAAAIVTTQSASKVYDGSALTESGASIEGLVGADTASVEATGSQTEVGESENTYSITWGNTNSGNYTISESLGTLSVTWDSASVVITAPSASKTYDGKPLTADGTGDKKFTVTGLPEGYTVEATASGFQTKAGSGANVVASYTVLDTAGEDKTAYFPDVQKLDGKLTVTRAKATVTARSLQKTVGEADPTLIADVSGLFGADSISYTLGRDAGEAAGGYTITPAGEAKQGSYDITYVPGVLAIYPVTKYALVVHFKYAISKADAASDFTGRYAANASYAIPLPAVSGYHAVDSNGKTIASLRGMMPAQDAELTVFYTLNPSLPAPVAAPAAPSVPALASAPAPAPAAAPILPAAKTADDGDRPNAQPKAHEEDVSDADDSGNVWVWAVGTAVVLALILMGVALARRAAARNNSED